ncbi:phosphatidylserine decarboxylase [Butyrivibrio sp. YAB3001]|uniref:phosphatidylserine decarboxylase n=1 Tax=Butyrivibrio sp. YAB3001 TaxID=1520812 RepID=UPI0008F6352C|nr:phosphatidylserine decarboxylase [Butyrivibrio sp. YAB3001]SFC99529.1 phosphatidylserine decarboxylase [Butyrivibrio sp. YAB3001]
MTVLSFLYNNRIGRILLRPLISRSVSELSGKFLDCRASKILIGPFIKKNDINVDDYQLENINCFNDFFCRRIKNGRRPIDGEKGNLIAPCDGLLSIYKITDDLVLSVKQSKYTISRLLKDKKLASFFDGGYVFVFRLCVNHYHRYVYFDSGKKYNDRSIKGIYHTVRPIALEKYPVFIENERKYSVIDSDGFGRAVQMEVGAMLVGRIVNDNPFECRVVRGLEKGHFEYGGSTIILLLSKDRVEIRKDFQDILNKNIEIPVVMGEVIGKSC